MRMTLILLFIYMVCEYSAYIPQIIKLIKTKSAKDLSMATWLMWIVAGASYLVYVLIESPEIGVVFAASLNLTFVLTVSLLALYYQKTNNSRKKDRE